MTASNWLNIGLLVISYVNLVWSFRNLRRARAIRLETDEILKEMRG